MAKVWHLTRLVIFISAVAVSITQFICGARPSQFALLFTNPDGTPCQRPCLFGVRPGETSYQHTIALLQTHPFTRRFEPNIDRGIFSGPGLSVIVFLNDGDFVTRKADRLNPQRVSRIDLVRTSDLASSTWASLGEVVATLGDPDFVAVDDDSTRSYYLAASMTFFHSGNTDGYVSPDDRFDCLFVSAHPPTTSWEPYVAAWHGFSSITRYRAAMGAQSD